MLAGPAPQANKESWSGLVWSGLRTAWADEFRNREKTNSVVWWGGYKQHSHHLPHLTSDNTPHYSDWAAG